MDRIVSIEVNGKPVKQYSKDGKVFIEAREGTEYTINVKNINFGKKLAVITVDGLNVITGKPQDEEVGQGYIVNPFASIEIKGFRKDLDSVGAFKFCKKDSSYCNESGLAGNNGVIGVRLYGEKINWTVLNNNPNPYKSYPYTGDNIVYRSGSQISTTCRSIGEPDFDVGTTWGKEVQDKVRNVSFDAEPNDFFEYVIYYDTKENLEKAGILKEEKTIGYPKAFGGFAKPPEGWKG